MGMLEPLLLPEQDWMLEGRIEMPKPQPWFKEIWNRSL
jgi:hypothetical protein